MTCKGCERRRALIRSELDRLTNQLKHKSGQAKAKVEHLITLLNQQLER